MYPVSVVTFDFYEMNMGNVCLRSGENGTKCNLIMVQQADITYLCFGSVYIAELCVIVFRF